MGYYKNFRTLCKEVKSRKDMMAHGIEVQDRGIWANFDQYQQKKALDKQKGVAKRTIWNRQIDCIWTDIKCIVVEIRYGSQA